MSRGFVGRGLAPPPEGRLAWGSAGNAGVFAGVDEPGGACVLDGALVDGAATADAATFSFALAGDPLPFVPAPEEALVVDVSWLATPLGVVIGAARAASESLPSA